MRLLQRSLTIREERLENDHPEVAATLNMLAGVLISRKEFLKAESLLLRSLSISCRKTGAREHPEVADKVEAL